MQFIIAYSAWRSFGCFVCNFGGLYVANEVNAISFGLKSQTYLWIEQIFSYHWTKRNCSNCISITITLFENTMIAQYMFKVKKKWLNFLKNTSMYGSYRFLCFHFVLHSEFLLLVQCFFRSHCDYIDWSK